MKFRLVFFNELYVALRPDDDQRCPAQGILQSFSLAVSLFLLRDQVGIADNLVMMQDDLEGVELGGRNQHSIRGFREPIDCQFRSFLLLNLFLPKKCVCSLETLQLRAELAAFLCARWVMGLSDTAGAGSLPVGLFCALWPCPLQLLCMKTSSSAAAAGQH